MDSEDIVTRARDITGKAGVDGAVDPVGGDVTGQVGGDDNPAGGRQECSRENRQPKPCLLNQKHRGARAPGGSCCL